MAPSAFLEAATSPISPLLIRQNAIASATGDVRATFSSWDNCMARDYCKWPVIAVIVIGSLIALSVLFCVVRCCCCGMECCCAACACMNACCPSPRGGKRDRTKYRDTSPPPRPYPGYQPTPAPFYATPTAPQFATFDASNKVKADSLPAMPSWDTSTSKKVLDDSPAEEVEMDKMDPHDEKRPMLANSPQVPQNGYGPGGYQDGYSSQTSIAAGAVGAGAFTSRPQPSAQGYRGVQRPGMSPPQGSFVSSSPSSQSYGQQQGFAAAAGYNQNSSQQNFNNGYGRTTSPYSQTSYGVTQPHDHDGYNDQQNYDSYNYAPAQNQTYAAAPAAPQPAYNSQQEFSRSRAEIPSALATGARNNPYPSTRQPQFRNDYPGQNQWRDV